MEIEEIEALLRLFERSSLTEMVVERDELRLIFRRQGGLASGETIEPARVEGEEIGPARGLVVRSPVVGTFYRCPNPDSEPFVKVGDRVHEGDTLAVVEAMKVLTEVKAAEEGIVEQILVEDGQPVEYGQELMVIKPLSS
ncbi:MAG: acetyl-CoA carboxylase biotin carboxyl carrier protein [Candidatus Bipolaricaulia bacterium]